MFLENLFSKNKNSDYRKRILTQTGIASICLFFILRGFNVYVDINPWEFQDSTTKTIISFFNVSKYPPSLAYSLITLGQLLSF